MAFIEAHENQNVQPQAGQVNSQTPKTVQDTVGETVNQPTALEQELTQKAVELKTQRRKRSETMVDITLEAIVRDVESQKATIDALKDASGKALSPEALRQIVEKEVIRAADGRLWCAQYSERAKSNQQVNIFVGTHWKIISSQQWMDFVGCCARNCELSDQQLMSPTFMNPLYEGIAFNLKKHRRPMQPDDEVWLNMANGTLVVSKDGSVKLRSHHSDDLFFYCLDYAYDPQADCQLWETFLHRVLPDTSAQVVLGEFLGYCLMRHHRYEKLLCLYGSGKNGKSTALTVVEQLFGPQNISFLSLEQLTDDEKKRAMFEHKLVNISSETGRNVNASVMKQIASGEALTVEQKYQDPRHITDYGKVIMATNLLPRAENTPAFYRRFIILPFEQAISEEEKDVNMAEKLKAELPGILNWVVKALVGLMKRQAFTTCESSERALKEYNLEADNVMLFNDEKLEPSDSLTKGQDLYGAYGLFCSSSGLKPLGRDIFYKRLEELTHSRRDVKHVAYFNLKLSE